jgi:endonuclease VIII
VPEGDTIFRSARAMHAALAGRVVDEVRTHLPHLRRAGVDRLAGQRVEAVEARGKHLLHRFTPSGLLLHSHMRMTGSWHLYAPGAAWRKPTGHARLVLRTAELEAVCFSAPVLELLTAEQAARHPSLAALGVDPLAGDATGPVDLRAAGAALAARGDVPIGEALLDQGVLAGVGNVYKCEVLFLHRVDPWTPVAAVPADVRAALLGTATALLRANVAHGGPQRITTRRPSDVRRAPRGSDALHVYGKGGRPCPRCGTAIATASLGEQARLTYWCPRCQGPGPAGRRSARGAAPHRGPDDR